MITIELINQLSVFAVGMALFILIFILTLEKYLKQKDENRKR